MREATLKGYPAEDKRVVAVLDAFRALTGPEKEEPSWQDYRQYCNTPEGQGLPGLQGIVRLFGGWDELVQYAEHAPAPSAENQPRGRFTEQELIEGLQYVGKALGVRTLSCGAYDEYRKEHPDLHLPSSSVIRKWLKKWEKAVEIAGLQAPKQQEGSRPDPITVLRALRRAQRQFDQPLTPHLYNQLAYSEEGWPEMDDIRRIYGSWEVATRAANIEVADDLPPGSLWTVQEAREALHFAQSLIRGRMTGSRYEQVRAHRSREMPPWSTVCQVLRMPEN